DASGSGNGNFKFTLIDNDPVAVYGTPFAIFTFYSPTGEFEPVKRTVKLPATTAEYHPATHGGWAGCNIYWDGSKLTFDDVGETAHQYYQGVFFMWGSLYGKDANQESNFSYWEANNICYSPDPLSSAGWLLERDVSELQPIIGNVDNSYDNAILYALHDPLAGKGDICRYITEVNGGALHGKKWRMPTSVEFAGIYTKSGGIFDNATSSASSSDGTWVNSTKNYPGYTKNEGNVFFPASGFRQAGGDGEYYYLTNVGSSGFYWSSSALGYYDAYNLSFFYNETLHENNSSDRYQAYPVRCVAE
ncbi:MAG: hypothetical protein LBR26_07800, partial [Prevotella sp.]|nr:hypothetical protein [Prevotella sp.]